VDQNLLVKSGHIFVQALDDMSLSPRAAMWVFNSDTDTWKLWIVPNKAETDKRIFYRKISSIVSRHRKELGGIDAADVELVSDNHPAIEALGQFMRMEGLGSAHFTGNRLNGFFLPDGIVLRMNVS